MNKIDPDGKIDKNVIKELAKGNGDKRAIRERIKQLDSDEVAALNSGKVKLTDLQGRNGRTLDPKANIGQTITEASRHSSRFNQEYDAWLQNLKNGKADRADRPIADAGYLMDNPVTKDWWLKAHGSSGNTKADAKSVTKIVSEYRKEHPNTRLSSASIVQNYIGNGSKESGARTSPKPKLPKLTLNPDTAKAGAEFAANMAKTTSNLVELSRMNQQQQAQAQRGAKAVDDYTKELSGKGKKK